MKGISFYTYIPKITIIWYTVPEIRSETDRIFCHFGPFCPFTPTQRRKSGFWHYEKNTWRYYHLIHVYHKWQSYDATFLRYRAWQNFRSFWTIFCPFIPQTTQKIKILQQWKKRQEISSFYTFVPNIMITWCTVSETWYATDRWTDGRSEKVTYSSGCST